MRRRRRVVQLLLAGGVLLLLALSFWARALRVPAIVLPASAGTLVRDSIRVGGRYRTFDYYLPHSFSPPAPLLLVLHGSGMTGAGVRRATGAAFDSIAEREGIVVAYPDGVAGNWNDCRTGGDFEARRLKVDDVAFMSEVVQQLAAARRVDPRRVFAAGVSNGGQLAYRLGLEAPDLVRGIAVIAANLPPLVPEGGCRATGRPLPVLIINGTADPLNPYDGGQVALWGFMHKRGLVRSAEESARYWAGLAGMRPEAVEEPMADADPHDGTTATRRTWSLPGTPRVQLVSVTGGGHAIPQQLRAGPRIFGRISHDFSAPAEIWAFFRAVLASPTPDT